MGSSIGSVSALGVESTGSYAAGLVRYLRREDQLVLEVNQPHPHTRRRRGKSDPIDAELAARHVLAGDRLVLVIAKDTTGIVEAIRQLRVARDGAVKARTAALNALGGLIISAPEELRREILARKTIRGRASLCARFRPDLGRLHEPTQAAKAALRSIARRVKELDAEIADLGGKLKQLINQVAPRTIARIAVSAGHASTLIVTAGQNIDRLHHEASFAALCGASPIPVSTGRNLSYGGNRDANRALHMIAGCRLRYCERTREYAQRRIAEGKTKTEIIRCLKRYIGRELYHALVADLMPHARAWKTPDPIIAIACGAGMIGRTVSGLDIYRNVPPRAQAAGIMRWAYSLDPPLQYFAGGYFWWYAAEDALRPHAPLAKALRHAFRDESSALDHRVIDISDG